MSTNRNARLRVARLWLHDFVCETGGSTCHMREDHARREQHDAAREIVDSGDYRAIVHHVHLLFHPRCKREIDGHMNFAHPRLIDFAHSLGIEPTEPRKPIKSSGAADK